MMERRIVSSPPNIATAPPSSSTTEPHQGQSERPLWQKKLEELKWYIVSLVLICAVDIVASIYLFVSEPSLSPSLPGRLFSVLTILRAIIFLSSASFAVLCGTGYCCPGSTGQAEPQRPIARSVNRAISCPPNVVADSSVGTMGDALLESIDGAGVGDTRGKRGGEGGDTGVEDGGDGRSQSSSRSSLHTQRIKSSSAAANTSSTAQPSPTPAVPGSRGADEFEQQSKYQFRAYVIMAFCFVGITAESVFTGIQITGYSNVNTICAAALCLTVFCMNFEFLLVKAVVETFVSEEGVLIQNLHEHRLYYTPEVSMANCKICAQRIGPKTGGKQAYECRDCVAKGPNASFCVCLNCFRKQSASDGSAEAGSLRGDKGPKPPFDFSAKAYVKRAWGLTKPFRLNFLIALLCTVAARVSSIISPNYQGQLINTLVNENATLFHRYLTMFVLLQVTQAFFGSVQGLTVGLCSRQITLSIRKDMFKSLIKQDIAFYDSQMVGALTSRMTTDAFSVTQPVNLIMNTALPNLLTFVGGFFMCFYTSWKLTMLALTMIGPVIYITGLYASWAQEINKQIRSCNADANAGATESLKNVRTVRCFSADQVELNVFSNYLTTAWSYMRKDAWANAGVNTITNYVNFAASVLVFIYGGNAVLSKSDSQLDIGKLVTFNMYWQMLRTSMTALNNMINTIIVSTSAAKRVFEIIELEPDIALDDGTAIKIPSQFRASSNQSLNDQAFDIEFKNVQFTYQTRPDKKIFTDVCFTIPAGTSCAFVGKSGMGKSTVMGLLLRFYDPQKGEVLLNGKPLPEYNLRSFHRRIGIVQQETQVFARSVKDNLTYGLEEGVDYKENDITMAAKRANAHEFIEEMDLKYDSLLSESGSNLSGGQKQRLSIARAFLRRPTLLLLDEATSALDTKNEREIQTQINDMVKDMSGKCSVVMIAHRLSTIENANQIVIINDGIVSEHGTHAELVNQENGIYAELVKQQHANTEGNGDGKATDATDAADSSVGALSTTIENQATVCPARCDGPWTWKTGRQLQGDARKEWLKEKLRRVLFNSVLDFDTDEVSDAIFSNLGEFFDYEPKVMDRMSQHADNIDLLFQKITEKFQSRVVRNLEGPS